jgi:hypothetical protein
MSETERNDLKTRFKKDQSGNQPADPKEERIQPHPCGKPSSRLSAFEMAKVPAMSPR